MVVDLKQPVDKQVWHDTIFQNRSQSDTRSSEYQLSFFLYQCRISIPQFVLLTHNLLGRVREKLQNCGQECVQPNSLYGFDLTHRCMTSKHCMLSNRSRRTLISDWSAHCCFKSNTPHLTAGLFLLGKFGILLAIPLILFSVRYF